LALQVGNDATPGRDHPESHAGERRYLSRSAAVVNAAWAAASRATGTRNGEQDT
jgi:hypothetical protein